MNADPRAAAASWADWVRGVERLQAKLRSDIARVESAVQNLEILIRKLDQTLAGSPRGAAEPAVPAAQPALHDGRQEGCGWVPEPKSDITIVELQPERCARVVSSGVPPQPGGDGQRFDLVVDETRNRLLLQRGSGKSKREQTISQIPAALRVMLWLAMSHVGTGIKFEEIEALLGWQRLDRASRDARIYQYRLRLNRLLGVGLARRMFGLGRSATYHVNETGWSYRWIRRAREPNLSLLLRTLPSSPLRSPEST